MFQKAMFPVNEYASNITSISAPLVYTVRQLVWWKSMWLSLKWCLAEILVTYLVGKHAIIVQAMGAIIAMMTGMTISSKISTENGGKNRHINTI